MLKAPHALGCHSLTLALLGIPRARNDTRHADLLSRTAWEIFLYSDSKELASFPGSLSLLQALRRKEGSQSGGYG